MLVTGTVQGVGFRPFVYRLAMEHDVKGYVSNQRGSVLVEVEGPPARVAQFCHDLATLPVPPARVEHVTESRLPALGYEAFNIQDSGCAGRSQATFPPDLAVCPTCLADVADPASRWAGYPFTSCTYCGPRYAVVSALPYDRGKTTMRTFPLCDSCRTEYADPLNRRFHAQTIACPECGPTIQVWADPQRRAPGEWLPVTQAALLAGKIAAVKGIGGFHLICDATQRETLERLRTRKRRPRKPFALMVRDLETAAAAFELSAAERRALASPRAPIVLLRPRPRLAEQLPLELLAPGHQRLGVMLAYSPLHFLLFLDHLPFLVVTSGNSSGLPIVRTNEEAFEQLGQIADLFVLHNREIAARVEDSVCQAVDDTIYLIRRSRGYVPEALTVPVPTPAGAAPPAPVILAAGAEQKNTVCVLRGNQAVLGPYMGDISSLEHIAAWEDGARHLTDLFEAEPQIVAYDPHPAYLVSQAARRAFAADTADRAAPVYHHHAHMTACMAEHGLREPVIGCILDGTGFGRDGSLWGFEILAGDYLGFDRIVYLRPMTLPGGETAIHQPWLLAVSLFHDSLKDTALTAAWAQGQFPQHEAKLPLVLAQLDGRLPSPRVSSAGRLFDAVAAMLGLCTAASYEGEAAALLGEQAEAGPVAPADEGIGTAAWAYPVARDGDELQTAQLLRGLIDDMREAVPVPVIARKFHRTVGEMVCQGALEAQRRTGLRSVVLGGGVWQNRYLLTLTRDILARRGFQVYMPERVPAGDGGIALGQAVTALWRWQRDVSRGAG